MYRFVLASIVFLPLYLMRQKPTIKQYLTIFFPSMITSVMNIVFFYVGLQYTTANASVIIYAAVPLVVATFTRIIFRDHISKEKLIGIIVGFLGVLIVLVLPILSGNTSMGTLLGNSLIMCAAVSWSLYTVGSRQIIAKGYSAITLSGTSFFTSAICFTILSFLLPDQRFGIERFTDPLNIFLIIHLVILVTVVTFLMYQWMIKHTSATTASLNNFTQPLFGIVINMIVLGELASTEFVIGSAITLLGVYLATTDYRTKH